MLLALLVLAAPAGAEQEVVTLATLDWKPYVSEALDDAGFTTEIVREAFRRAGYRVRVTFMPWIRVLSEVRSGRFDAMYPAYHSDSRARIYALSEPIAHGPLVLCKRSDLPFAYRSLADLEPFRIGVVRGYVNTPAFDAADHLDKRIVNSDKQNLLKVMTGRIDLAVIDMYTAQQIIASAIPQATGNLVFVEPPLEVKPLYVGFSRARVGYRKRLEQFNRALREMREEGVVREIHGRYGFRAYGIRPSPAESDDREAVRP